MSSATGVRVACKLVLTSRSVQRLKESVFLSHRWEARSLREHLQDPRQQAMYAVIHGGTDRELRQLSINYLTSLPFDGFAMGGSFGKLGDELVDIISFMTPQLPKDRPNHLLGIADLPSIRKCVPLGVDTFDSAFPTRIARHGCLLAEPEDIKISNSKWAHLHEPISPYLPYTAAYLHHLFKAKVRCNASQLLPLVAFPRCRSRCRSPLGALLATASVCPRGAPGAAHPPGCLQRLWPDKLGVRG